MNSYFNQKTMLRRMNTKHIKNDELYEKLLDEKVTKDEGMQQF